jgi:hypothetical protein
VALLLVLVGFAQAEIRMGRSAQHKVLRRSLPLDARRPCISEQTGDTINR